LYQLEELITINQIKRRQDLHLVKQLSQKGYMEASGYAWAYPRAAEIDEICKSLIENFKKNQ
jgi:hypothetical protein